MSAHQTDAERRIARNVVWMLDEFRKLTPNIEAQTIQVFFLVAATPGIRMKEIEKATGLASSSVSRNVLMLSSVGWKKDADGKTIPGYDLLVTATDPFNATAKVATLTPRGRKLFEKLTTTMMERP